MAVASSSSPAEPLPTVNVSKKVRVCATTKAEIDVCWRQILPTSVSASSALETILLVPGQNANLHAYELPFCRMLADKTGCQVIAIDNRDSGRGTRFDSAGAPWTYSLVAPTWMSPSPAYFLTDMALDALALLDSLKVDKVHVVGTSMGGMICQIMATMRPERALSLTSMFSSTGGAGLSSQPWWVRWHFLTNNPPKDAAGNTTLEQMIAWKVGFISDVLLPATRTAEQKQAAHLLLRARVEAEMNHSMYRAGGMRQVAAILHSPRWEDQLAKIKTPTLCVAGKLDNLFQNDHHERFKQVVKHSKMLVLEDAGHFLEHKDMDRVASAIAELVASTKQKQQKQ